MTVQNITRVSLAQIKAMRERGEARTDPAAPEGPELGDDFWQEAELIDFSEPKSVHLKLDPEVFLWFKSRGKGHITRMQNVLKAYVNAQKKRAAE